MHGFEIGQQVKLATMEQVIFTVTMINPDGSYVIEAALSTEQTLTYSNVSQEMLRLVYRFMGEQLPAVEESKSEQD